MYRATPVITEVDFIHGDCVPIMLGMKPGSVDVCCTSPPYNLGIKYSQHMDEMAVDDYLAWAGEWKRAIWQVLAKDGSFFLNIGSSPSSPLLPYHLVLEMARNFKLQNVFHWVKSISVETRAGETISAGHFKPINSKRFVTDCFVGETLVDTSEGFLPIERLAAMSAAGGVLPYAFSYDLEKNTPVLRKIQRAWQASKTHSLVEITTEKGIKLRCTPEHRFLLYDGTYLAAASLTTGVRLRKIPRIVNKQRGNRRVIRHYQTDVKFNRGGLVQARFVWEQINGPIPDGMDVHHKNEDTTDDRPSNLELLPNGPHSSLHHRGDGNGRFLPATTEDLVQVWEAVESQPKLTHKVGNSVTPTRWNRYIKLAGLQGRVPFAKSSGIQGKSWEAFSLEIESKRSEANDRVAHIRFINLPEAVPVYDLEVEGAHNFGVTNGSIHSIVVHNCHEFVFHFTKYGDVKLDRLAIGVEYADKSNIARRGHKQDKRCRGNNWFIPYETIQSRDKERPHPATFPSALPEQCIRLHGNISQLTVLDPFVGIGNSAVAALRCGVKRFIGIDVDEGYLETAKQLIKE